MYNRPVPRLDGLVDFNLRPVSNAHFCHFPSLPNVPSHAPSSKRACPRRTRSCRASAAIVAIGNRGAERRKLLRRIPSAKWRELIKKVWEADPLLCPKRRKEMRIVSLIDDRTVIERILHHLGLWEQGVRLSPARAPPEIAEIVMSGRFAASGPFCPPHESIESVFDVGIDVTSPFRLYFHHESAHSFHFQRVGVRAASKAISYQ